LSLYLVKSVDLLLNSPVLCFIADGAARVAVRACVASIPILDRDAIYPIKTARISPRTIAYFAAFAL